MAAMASIRDQYLIVLSKLPVTTTFISLTKWIDLSRMERAERTQRENERPTAAPAVPCSAAEAGASARCRFSDLIAP